MLVEFFMCCEDVGLTLVSVPLFPLLCSVYSAS